MVQERYKKGELEQVPAQEYRPLEFDENAGYAIVYRQRFTKQGTLEKSTLKINSSKLLKMFIEVVISHPSVPSGFEKPFAMESPFEMPFHHWTNLEKRRTSTEDDTERMHLNLLLDFMEGEMGHQRSEVRNMINNNTIQFRTLWTIFKPGEVMYMADRGEPCLLRLEKTVYEESSSTGRRFEVHCIHTYNDGRNICMRIEIVKLYEKRLFGGGTQANIQLLPVYPFSLFESNASLIQELEERGNRMSKLSGVIPVHYRGVAKFQRLPPKSFFHRDMGDFAPIWDKCSESGRVVIDPETYLEEQRYEADQIRQGWPDEFRIWAEAKFASLQTAKLVLCAPYIIGYSLQRKDWCKLYLNSISSIDWNLDSINGLVLPDGQKSILKALVSLHQYSDNPREQSEQKGKGLVILLHGIPGTGKTMTAEVSAEISKSPLLPISLGELYEGSYFDEYKLKELLQHATIWKAIVLIDEADVFLKKRASGGGATAERNALVAVFLRFLEYFSGIVFLTSNRVEDFDTAMKSRIHLALQYKAPTVEHQRFMWMTRLSSLPAEELDANLIAIAAELSKYDMNGREISNSVNTARTLARYAGEKLQLNHLMTVIEVWGDFNISLARLQRKNSIVPRQDSFVTMPRGSDTIKEEKVSRWMDPE